MAGCLDFGPDTLPAARNPPENVRAVERLAQGLQADPVRFAIIGDTQLSFGQAAKAVASLSARDDLAFAVQIGDLTHHGIRFEYEKMDGVLRALDIPLFVLLGNHDTLGNGRKIYARLYGPTDFVADQGPFRFVFFDSCSREVGFGGRVPDVTFLEDAMEMEEGRVAVLFAHVPPWGGDFDPVLQEPFGAVTAGATLAFYGHEHRYEEGEFAGVPSYLADAIENRNYLVATVRSDGVFEVERVVF